MGTREFGFTSSIPGYRNYASDTDRAIFAELIPTKRGYAYPQIIDAIDRGEIRSQPPIHWSPTPTKTNQNRFQVWIR